MDSAVTHLALFQGDFLQCIFMLSLFVSTSIRCANTGYVFEAFLALVVNMMASKKL